MALFGAKKKRSGASPLPRQRAARKPVRERAPARRAAVPARRASGRVEQGWGAFQALQAAAASLRSAGGSKSAEREPFAWALLGQRLLPLAALMLIASLGYGGWLLLDHVGSVPVSRVVFTGKLQHVDRQEMVERVQPLLVGEGFLTADIDAMRSSLLELPWVADAAVQRRWPDELVVKITEQHPVARWGEDGLLNRRGEVFRPQPLTVGSDLPALFGPDEMAAEVISRYVEFNDLLAARGLRLARLGADQRGSWRLELEGGVTLRLGTSNTLKRMRRFLSAYDYELKDAMDRIAYIDLRYSNGLAVGWKDPSFAGATISDKQAVPAGVAKHG
ncbi:MAG: cell division protein FtsQ/DivIB [Spongiibacteraceae bacterium]|jgi:cell division protein FtsQ|nr:cell division protein FtsQ/DivIB [Spongiibacteraceae bacterium]